VRAEMLKRGQEHKKGKAKLSQIMFYSLDIMSIEDSSRQKC
jgi:hypothetical protein